MRVQADIQYPAGPHEVAAMLADPAFLDRYCAATGAVRHTADVDGDADGPFTVTTVRTMPTDDFPDVARRFVGETVDIRQVDSWRAAAGDGSREGTSAVEISGTPLRLTGTLRLAAGGEGTVEVVDGNLKASVPLIGGALEKAAEPAIRAALRKQGKVAAAWLTEA